VVHRLALRQIRMHPQPVPSLQIRDLGNGQRFSIALHPYFNFGANQVEGGIFSGTDWGQCKKSRNREYDREENCRDTKYLGLEMRFVGRILNALKIFPKQSVLSF